MITLKHGLAFPMLGAAGWLIWVLERQAGSTALAAILTCCLVLSFAAWLYGMAQKRQMMGRRHWALHIATAAMVVLLIPPLLTLKTATTTPDSPDTVAAAAVAWTPQNVEAIKVRANPFWSILRPHGALPVRLTSALPCRRRRLSKLWRALTPSI